MNAIDLFPVLFIDHVTAADFDAWLRLVGRLHPLFVHFPLAFVVLAALVEAAHLCTRRPGIGASVRLLLVAAALGAVAAAASGWLNAGHEWASLDATWRAAGSPDGPTAADASHLGLHRFMSLGVAAGLVLVAIGAVATGSEGVGGVRALTRIGLAAVLGGTLFTGHLGGELVHGRGHVLDALAPATAGDASPTPTPAPSSGPAADSVGPAAKTPVDGVGIDDPVMRLAALETRALEILEVNCAECHGADKQKAGLQLVPLSSAFAWDPQFWTIEPGDADASLVVERIELPVTDRSHMPPDGPSLSDADRAAIRAWIDAGALVEGLAPGDG